MVIRVVMVICNCNHFIFEVIGIVIDIDELPITSSLCHRLQHQLRGFLVKPENLGCRQLPTPAQEL